MINVSVLMNFRVYCVCPLFVADGERDRYGVDDEMVCADLC